MNNWRQDEYRICISWFRFECIFLFHKTIDIFENVSWELYWKKNFNLILVNYFNIFMNGSSDKLFKYGGPQSSKTQK